MIQLLSNKRFMFFSIITTFIIFIETSIVYAQIKSYKICLAYSPGFINSANEGIGSQLNKEILKRIEQRKNVSFEVSFYPAKRALLMFNKGKFDIVFATILGDSGSDQTTFQNDNTIDSAPVAGSGYSIFTLKSSQKLSKLEDLYKKRIGIIGGITLPDGFDKISTEFTEEVSSIEKTLSN